MQFFPLLFLVLTAQASASEGTRFLELARVVSPRPERGDVFLVGPDGNEILLREGDLLAEEGGAKLKDVTSSVLVFTRKVSGGDGEKGESIIVVRFNSSGKTRVREYRTVGDVPTPRAPRPDSR
jgi:hypothetical protein